MSLTVIISQLPKLSQDDLKTLRAAIDGLIQQDANRTEPLLYEAVRCAVSTVPPYSTFVRIKGFTIWLKHVEYAENFVSRNFPTASKLERQALMTFAVQAIVRDLKARNVPITAVTVARNLGRFAEAFEAEFPGYIQSGMQPMILKAMKEKT